jgi:hypothetical protein
VNEQMTVEQLEKLLPSGSGIDCKWKITDKGSYFKCENSYHVMNDIGNYVGYIDFSVIIIKHSFGDFRLYFHVNSTGRKWVNNTQLREYLDDTIYKSLYSVSQTSAFLSNEYRKDL